MKKTGKLIIATLLSSLSLNVFAACNATDETEGDESFLPEQSVETPLPSDSDDSQTTTPEEEPLPPTEEPTPPKEEPPAPKTIRYVRIKTDALNIRTKPSVSSTVLGQVDAGVGMTYLGEENGFYKTYYKNKTAYVSAKKDYTELFTANYAFDEIENIILEGCKVIGTPYVYGAVRYHDGNGKKYKSFTTTKFDCSSLTQYIFYMGNGTLLQVNTRTQIYQGEYVAKKDLQRGDLIFFTNDSRRSKIGIERVGHVALYLGDNLILHTASDYCKIESINAKRWNDYIEARRMVNPNV